MGSASMESPAQIHVRSLQRRRAFEARHPEVTITTPLTSKTGRWEVDWGGPGDTARHREFDHVVKMLDFTDEVWPAESDG